MTVFAATDDTFDDVWTAAKDGDDIVLHGLLAKDRRPRGKLLTRGITLHADDAVITKKWYLAGPMRGLTILDGTWAGLQLDGPENIKLQGASFERDGVQFNRGENLSVENCRFAKRGLKFDHCTDVSARINSFFKCGVDGIDGGCVKRVVFELNFCHYFQLVNGQHPDCIQLWSRPDMITQDVVIRDNTLVCERAQGASGFNHQREQLPGFIPEGGTPLTAPTVLDDGGFDRITFDGNLIVVGYPDALVLTGGRSSVVTNNRIRTWPGVKSQAQIHTDKSPGIVRHGNTVEAYDNGSRRWGSLTD